jgi:glycosyltransferase involved in cell wall biosynthesis
VILFLHNRYRTAGGEERAVEDLAWLAREHLGEDAELLERDSASLGRARAAAGLLRGGLDPADVGDAVRRTGARIVHAHNLTPALGWRALAAARAAGARVVLHLHNYRLVCAVGTCVDSRGEDCTRCQGRDTRPGVRLNCRGSAPEAAAYALALALWQRRLAGQADAIVVPSAAAHTRLLALRAPLAAPVHVVGAVLREPAAEAPAPRPGAFALVASRLAREKGVEVAVDASLLAGTPLVICGEGPRAAALRAHAVAAGARVVDPRAGLDAAVDALAPGDVLLAGHVARGALAALRARAGVALVPTRAAETFGLAAVEAMGAGLPVAASALGALAELGPADGVALAAPGDPAALARAMAALRADPGAGARALAAARRLAAPEAVAPRLAAAYAAADDGARGSAPSRVPAG